jgi:membrane protein required for colicin V production
MGLVWIDWVILIILMVAVISGFIKGLMRQLIFILFVLAGFIVAARYFSRLAPSLRPALANETWARFLSFLLIFAGFLLIGWLLSYLIFKLIKGPLRVLDIILGGLFGFVKGVLIASVFVLALLLFPVKEKDLIQSQLAYPCLSVSRLLIQLVPRELKTEFQEAYRQIRGGRQIRKV